MEKIEQQGITSGKIPKEYTPVVFDESLPDETSSFQYGSTIKQLRPGIEVEKSTWWLFSWTVTYTTTGVKTVSWVGFTPRLIKITATLATGAISHGIYYNGAVSCSYYFTGAGVGDVSWNVWYSAYLDNAWNATISTTITPTNDWFTINVTHVSWGAVTMIYECYG